VADTEYATTLSREGESIRTVEHLLAALHAYGITNLLVKVHGEIPVLDGSALEFCERLEEVGIEMQGLPRKELVIDRRYEAGSGDRRLVIEPAETFSVSYLSALPAPGGGNSSMSYHHEGLRGLQDRDRTCRTFGLHARSAMMASSASVRRR